MPETIQFANLLSGPNLPRFNLWSAQSRNVWVSKLVPYIKFLVNWLTVLVSFLFQNHAFVKKTEEEYEKVVNFGDWVCKVMKIQPPS